MLQLTCSAMGPLTLLPTYIIVTLSVARCQQWNKTATPLVIFHVGAHVRSTCVFLYYNQETLMLDKIRLLLQVQKALTLRQMASAVISIDQLIAHHHLGCRSNRPLYVLFSSATLRQVSSKVRLSDAVWILFSNFQEKDVESLQEFFHDVYIPLDCHFLVAHSQGPDNIIIISEVYHVTRDLPLAKNYFGILSHGAWVTLATISFFERRNDLQGMTMKVATMTEPPVTIVKTVDGRLVLEGFFGKVWQVLEKRMNFTSEFIMPADTAWGSLTHNGSWNGMIGMIVRGEAEIAVAEFTMTALRAEAVDFTVPLINTRNCVLIRQISGEKDPTWYGFLKPLSSQLWALVILTQLVIILCLNVVRRLKLRCLGRKSSDSRDDGHFAAQIVGIFFLQGVNVKTGFCSERFLYLVAQLSALTIHTAYAAFLISCLTVHKFSLPFDSLRELIDIGTYRLGVLANSGQLNIFNNATDDLMREVYAKLIAPDKDNLPTSIEEGMQRVCDVNCYAFMTSLDVVLGLLDNITCELSSVLGASIPESLAMSAIKQSPYLGLVNHNLRAMFRSGVLKRLRAQEWPTELPPATVLWVPVDLPSTRPFLAVLGGALLVSALLLTAERLLGRRRQSVSCKVFCPKNALSSTAANSTANSGGISLLL